MTSTCAFCRAILAAFLRVTRPPQLSLRQVLEPAMLTSCGLFFLGLAGCHSGTPVEPTSPVTITYFTWGLASSDLRTRDEMVFSRFTEQTGIRVHYIQGPESSTETLQMYQESLKNKPIAPDIYLIDVVWPGLLADHFADLNSLLGAEANEHLDVAVQNDTVQGKLVAIPFFVQTGVLYYRTDLLAKYGYQHPPETWDELEKMAARIQAGERAAGNPHFWGFVWQGAAYEGLTCNALEWQVSQGGGRIIEEDGTISVNNPQSVAAMKRARRWVGTISPPSVTEFKEEDSRNAFESGNAAFRREWTWLAYTRSRAPGSPVLGKFTVTKLPGGTAGHASVMGGGSLAVSKYSAHPREAAEFVRYMTSKEVQLKFWDFGSAPPARKDFFEDRQYLHSRPDLEGLRDLIAANGATARPSTISGVRYAEVSQAYFSAVHSILTGQAVPEKAMADLESQLVKITGFHPGKPKPIHTAAYVIHN